MKLRVMTTDGANVPGRIAIVLCDENGNMLPQQIAAVIEQEEHEMSTITVKFGIDGRDVVLDGGRSVD